MTYMTYEQNIDVYTKEGELVRRFAVSDQGTEHFVPLVKEGTEYRPDEQVALEINRPESFDNDEEIEDEQ